MAIVLLVRHGRTAANAGGGLAGRQPVELDEVGRSEAVALGERLRSVPVAAVVTSPMIRCRQTLDLALPGADTTTDERLTECGYGDWEGQQLRTLAKDPLWRVVQVHPSAVTFPGGESMAGMAARGVAAIRDWDARVTAEHGPDAIWVACTHGDLIKAIVADALGLHLDLFQRIAVNPASVSVINYTQFRPFLYRLNDTGGDLSGLRPPKRRKARRTTGSDAAVGGGEGDKVVG